MLPQPPTESMFRRRNALIDSHSWRIPLGVMALSLA